MLAMISLKAYSNSGGSGPPDQICALHAFILTLIQLQKVASGYMQHVFKLHGLLVTLVSDRDATFTSHSWSEQFKLQCVDLALSAA